MRIIKYSKQKQGGKKRSVVRQKAMKIIKIECLSIMCLCVFLLFEICNAQVQDEKHLQERQEVLYNDKSLDEWVKALYSEEEEIRLQAAKALVEIGQPAYPALNEVLRSPYQRVEGKWIRSDVQGNTMRSLVVIGPPAIPALLYTIRVHEGVDFEGHGGFWALIEIGLAACPVLENLLKDEDEEVRRSAAQALGILGWRWRNLITPSALSALAMTLREDSSPEVRMEVADAFESAALVAVHCTPDPILEDIVTALTEALQDENSKVRRNAASALSTMKADNTNAGRIVEFPQTESLIAILIDGFNHKGWKIWDDPPWTLGRIGLIAESTVWIELFKEREGVYPAALANIREIEVQRLLANLEDPDGKVRSDAAIGLGNAWFWSESEVAVPMLIKALQDENKEVRVNTIRALGKLSRGDETDVMALISALHDDKDVRCEAVRALGRIGSKAKAAVPDLIVMLENEECFMSGASHDVFTALGDIGPAAEQAIPALLAILSKDPSYDITQEAPKALGRIGPAALSVLISLLKHEDLMVRSETAQALYYLGPDAIPAVSGLIAALDDEYHYVRENAIRALGLIGPAAHPAVPKLVSALRDDNNKIGILAAEALGSIGPAAKDAIPEINRAMKERKDGPAKEDIMALIKLGDTTNSVPAIIEMLRRERENESPDIELFDVLAEMGARANSAVELLKEMLNEQREDDCFPSKDLLFRIACAKTLVKIDPESESAITFLKNTLKENNKLIRYASAVALVDTGQVSEEAVTVLKIMLNDEDKTLAIKCATVLAKIASERKTAITFLKKMFKNQGWSFRFSAAVSLANLGVTDKEITQTLTTTLRFRESDEDFLYAMILWQLPPGNKYERIAAAKALGEPGHDTEMVIPALTESLHDMDKEVRDAAFQSLQRIRDRGESQE